MCTVAWMRIVSNARASIKKKQLLKISQVAPLEVKEYKVAEMILLWEVQEKPFEKNATTIKGISVVLDVQGQCFMEQ